MLSAEKLAKKFHVSLRIVWCVKQHESDLVHEKKVSNYFVARRSMKAQYYVVDAIAYNLCKLTFSQKFPLAYEILRNLARISTGTLKITGSHRSGSWLQGFLDRFGTQKSLIFYGFCSITIADCHITRVGRDLHHLKRIYSFNIHNVNDSSLFFRMEPHLSFFSLRNTV